MKLAALALALLAGAGVTLALTLAPVPPYRPKKVNAVPSGKGVTLEVEGEHARKRRVVVAAAVCLREGVLEQLLTRKGTKEHEAILSADVDARDIHKALLVAGAAQGCPARYNPNYAPANGQVIRVTLEWQDNGKPRRARAQDWVRDVRTKAPMAHDWVFAGSQLVADPLQPAQQRYLANEGDVICVANFETALLDLPVRSPKEQADLAFEANTASIPPVGTKVKIVLEPIPPNGRE
jgi:hypothetical protein